MNAQRFHGDADGPDLVIDRAVDDTPLADGCGWTCGCCEAIWATRASAERCCRTPGVEDRAATGRGWPRLYTSDE